MPPIDKLSDKFTQVYKLSEQSKGAKKEETIKHGNVAVTVENLTQGTVGPQTDIGPGFPPDPNYKWAWVL